MESLDVQDRGRRRGAARRRGLSAWLVGAAAAFAGAAASGADGRPAAPATSAAPAALRAGHAAASPAAAGESDSTDSLAHRREAPAGSALHAVHRDPSGFFNPWGRFERRTLFDFLAWKWNGSPYDKRRLPVIPRHENDGRYLSGVEHSATITWVGHATFAVHDRDDVFLTDPHFTKRALIPRRVVEPGVPLESIPPDAFAVVSHNHYDHLDEGTVTGLPASVGWYVPKGLGEWFRSRGRGDVTELDWWESARRGRFTLTCLPSQHWSRRIGQAENETLWCAWLVDSGDYRYFFAGDTGYFPGFAEYGRRFAPIDVAMLPIGAYEPRWFMGYQHMDPAQAYQAFLDLRADAMLPMHWGTFDLTDEPLDLPPRELAEVIAERAGGDRRVRIMAVGERWKVPERLVDPEMDGAPKAGLPSAESPSEY